MSCPDRETLADYADDALPVRAFDLVAKHLAACPDCRAHAETLRRESGLLRRAVREDRAARDLTRRVLDDLFPSDETT